MLNERGPFRHPRWAAFVRITRRCGQRTTGVVETRASYPRSTIAWRGLNFVVHHGFRPHLPVCQPRLPVQAGTVTGLTYGTTYYVYYDDLKRAGACLTPPQRRSRTPSPRPPIPPATTSGASPCPPPPGHLQRARRLSASMHDRIETRSFGRMWPPIRHAPGPMGTAGSGG